MDLQPARVDRLHTFIVRESSAQPTPSLQYAARGRSEDNRNKYCALCLWVSLRLICAAAGGHTACAEQRGVGCASSVEVERLGGFLRGRVPVPLCPTARPPLKWREDHAARVASSSRCMRRGPCHRLASEVASVWQWCWRRWRRVAAGARSTEDAIRAHRHGNPNAQNQCAAPATGPRLGTSTGLARRSRRDQPRRVPLTRPPAVRRLVLSTKPGRSARR